MKNGYVLLEVLVYIVILSLFATVSINGLILMTKSFTETRANRDLATAGAGAMERISREIRAGTTIDASASTFNTSPGALKLNTKDENNASHTILFNVSGSPSTLRLTRDGSLIGSIITPHVSVQTFIVRRITIGTIDAIKVELTLQEIRAAGNRTANFYDTVILRGTY